MDAHEARARVMEPVIGRTVQVTGGRKVPKGTKGSVFYRREGRIGLKSASGDTAFVDERYVTVIYPDLPAGVEPLDWVAFHDKVVAEERSVLAKYADFKVGDTNVTVSTPGEANVTGTLWWRKDRRISIRTSDRRNAQGNWADVVWCDVTDLLWKDTELALYAPVGQAFTPVFPYDRVVALVINGPTTEGIDQMGKTVVEFPTTVLPEAAPHLPECRVRILPG